MDVVVELVVVDVVVGAAVVEVVVEVVVVEVEPAGGSEINRVAALAHTYRKHQRCTYSIIHLENHIAFQQLECFNPHQDRNIRHPLAF